METVSQQQSLSLKNKCVEFMFAYQQKNLSKMLSFCDLQGTVEFQSLGEAGTGKIGELGKAIWGSLIECCRCRRRFAHRSLPGSYSWYPGQRFCRHLQ